MLASTGASLAAAMLMSLVWVLEGSVPSWAIKVTVRVAVEGLSVSVF